MKNEIKYNSEDSTLHRYNDYMAKKMSMIKCDSFYVYTILTPIYIYIYILLTHPGLIRKVCNNMRYFHVVFPKDIYKELLKCIHKFFLQLSNKKLHF